MAISVKDLGLDEDNDFLFRNGDIDIQFSDESHVQDILYSDLSHWKQYPLLGVSLQRELNSKVSNQQVIKRKVQDQLSADGYKIVDDISLNYNSDTKQLEYFINFERIRNIITLTDAGV